MKKLILILAIALFLCSEDEQPNFDKGCQTGIRKSSGLRETIRCCTRAEFLAGSNTDKGGIERVKYYTNVKWEVVASCSDCK